MRRLRTATIVGLSLMGLCGGVVAQRGQGRAPVNKDGLAQTPDRRGVPDWDVNPQFKSDVFTFVRVRYNYAGGIRGAREPWETDYPDSDWNIAFRLQQMTSMKVDPWGKILRLTDEEIFNYPFIYMLEIGRLSFTQEDIVCLRRYLLNGGFLMVDDFWGPDAYRNLKTQLARVFPNREPVELSLDHPIFHCVFDLKAKPQIPGIEQARAYRGTNRTWENLEDPEPHYRAIYDDKGRIMVLICHNTDLGDGWEREGEEEWFFHQFSEKQAYPMGVNIIFWAMTH